MIDLSQVARNDDQVVRVEIAIVQQHQRAPGSVTAEVPSATVDLILESGKTLLKERIYLPECGDVNEARNVASAFLISWISDLREAMSTQAAVSEVKIVANGDLWSGGIVTFLLNAYDGQQPSKIHSHEFSVEVADITSISEAEQLAQQSFVELLEAAHKEIEQKALMAVPALNSNSRYKGSPLRWLQNATKRLGFS